MNWFLIPVDLWIFFFSFANIRVNKVRFEFLFALRCSVVLEDQRFSAMFVTSAET